MFSHFFHGHLVLNVLPCGMNIFIFFGLVVSAEKIFPTSPTFLCANYQVNIVGQLLVFKIPNVIKLQFASKHRWSKGSKHRSC